MNRFFLEENSSTRLKNCLQYLPPSLEEIASMTEKEILKTPLLGKETLKELNSILRKNGLKLKNERRIICKHCGRGQELNNV